MRINALTSRALGLTAVGVLVMTAAAQDTATKPATKPMPAATKPAPAATEPAPAATEQTEPRIVEGSVNVYTWAPKDVSVEVDAKNVNLRKIFEDLGPNATRWYQHVQTLSDPFFEGRAPGSRGSEVAAEYIEFWMKQAKLAPAFPSPNTDGITPADGDWKTYRQEFSLSGGTPRVTMAKVTALGNELEEGKDFSVLGASGSNSTPDLPIVFAGYAIESGEGGYTSFAEGDDFNGKAVMFFRYEPLDSKGMSKWSKERFSTHSGAADKLDALAKRNASALIMVAPPGTVDGKTRLEEFATSRWGRQGDVPIIQMSADAAEALLRSADPKKSLMDWRVLADEGKVKTVQLAPPAKVTISTELSAPRIPAQNVGGALRGKGALADEWVVVGAHYDHVGMGNFGANPANAGTVHPGADDNASGTSALLILADELAKFYSSDDAPDELRSVLFLAFTAEESGLRGARWFVEHATIPAEKVSVMVNMDMVGRLRSDDLSVGGVGTAVGFMDVLRPAFERSGLTIHADPTGRGPSDHAVFYGASMPVLFVYTGNHEEYHTPADKGYTVNPAGASKIIDLVEDIVVTVAQKPERLAFLDTGSQAAPDRGYARVRLGVMPKMGGEEEGEAKHPKGVVVEAVSADTAAAKAGIKKGDVLVSWNGEALEDAGTMMSKLREGKPGDVVKIVVWREGKEMPVEVTLLASQPRA